MYAAKAFFGSAIYAGRFLGRSSVLCILFIALLFISINASAQTNTPAFQQDTNRVFGNAAFAANDSVVHPSEKIIPHIKQNIERYPAFYLYIFIGCFVLLAVIRLLSPSYLRELILSLFNLKLLLNIFKEGRFDWNVNNFLLDVISVLVFSIGLHQVFSASQPQFFVWILAFTAVAYFIKLILIQLFANIFFGRGEALIHLLMHTMFTRIVGLVLLPVLFAGLYQTAFPVAKLLFILSNILAVAYLLWLVRAYVKMKSISTGGIFYLFLYLCTIELSPIIILLKEVIL